MDDKNETYYEILRVSRGASISEIVTAYHAARGAFSKDSIAMYSLFSQDEADKVLKKLEEAYMTLSNIEKKREYDRSISNGEPTGERNRPFSLVPSPRAPIAPVNPSPSPSNQDPIKFRVDEPSAPAKPARAEEATDPQMTKPEMVTGAFLKGIRERRSLSVEDVARITKIPLRFLKAIENENLAHLPAKVYIQGFIKNLAVLYKLDPNHTARTFTSLIETKKTGT